MKFLKIVLAILAIIGIVLAIYFGYTKTTEVDSTDLPENQFTRRVSQEIKDISNQPDNRFCKDTYDLVKYHIDDYASMNRLGASLTDSVGNQQNQQFLLKTLYSAYADKFIVQADYVFRGNVWSGADLNFIKAEDNRLRSYGRQQGYLQTGSSVDKDFSRIIRTVDSYSSEVAFINECNSFSFNNRDLESRFPIDKAQAIISDSKSHLSSLGVVKNSDLVREGLSKIPDKVLSVHVSYLNGKINLWKDMYMYYATLAAYRTNLYDKLKTEISQLDNSMYSGLNASSQKSRLLNTLEADNSAAAAYFRNK
jgi:hypothetical protein